MNHTKDSILFEIFSLSDLNMHFSRAMFLSPTDECPELCFSLPQMSANLLSKIMN